MKAMFVLISFLFLLISFQTGAKTVRYTLVIEKKPMNMSGQKTVDFALTVNGGIPAPTLEFTEGDDAEITVVNQLPTKEDVSIHWHGILLPPEEDGVPFVNTPPIYQGQSRTFKFRIRQHGTYWYHSHTMLQEQKGVYGSLVIHPKEPTIKVDKDVVVVLSDWSDENGDQILKNLKKDGDYYLFKKDTIRSYSEAFQKGKLKNVLKNEWERMGGMDLSDVGYDAFLINGKRDAQLLKAQAGERIRLRIINAAASSYFYVSLGGLPMKVISADGTDIEPIHAEEILIGMAETYDVLFTVPENKNYELRATVQDVTGFASAWIGDGEKVKAKDVPLPDLYEAMDHSGHGDHGNHGGPGEHSSHVQHVVKSLRIDDVKALKPTTLPQDAKVTDLKLVLDGDMERYVWTVNGKTIAEDRIITVNPEEVVRFTFQNDSMMHHPMHLHGHFFRVLNKHQDYSPLKHTVDVPPMGTRTIEFYTNEPGQWMLHCHNLYHMETGMARVIRYSNFAPQGMMAEYDKQDHHRKDHWYSSGFLELSSNHAQTFLRASQSWNQLEARIEGSNEEGQHFSYKNEEWDYEGDLFYRRWLGKWTNVLIGATSYREMGYGAVGAGIIWPFLFETSALVDSDGQFRLDVEKKFQWTKTLFTNVDLTWRPGNKRTDETEIEVSLMYSPIWSLSIGLMQTSKSLGAGVEYQF